MAQNKKVTILKKNFTVCFYFFLKRLQHLVFFLFIVIICYIIYTIDAKKKIRIFCALLFYIVYTTSIHLKKVTARLYICVCVTCWCSMIDKHSLQVLKSLMDDFMGGETDVETVFIKCSASSKKHLSKAKQLHAVQCRQ